MEWGNTRHTFTKGLTFGRAPRWRRTQNTVALALVGAKVLGSTAEAILAATCVQRTSLARWFGIFAALGDSTAVGDTSSTTVRTSVTAIAPRSTACTVGTGLTRTTGVVIPFRQARIICRCKRRVIGQHNISLNERCGPGRALTLPEMVE